MTYTQTKQINNQNILDEFKGYSGKDEHGYFVNKDVSLNVNYVTSADPGNSVIVNPTEFQSRIKLYYQPSLKVRFAHPAYPFVEWNYKIEFNNLQEYQSYTIDENIPNSDEDGFMNIDYGGNTIKWTPGYNYNQSFFEDYYKYIFKLYVRIYLGYGNFLIETLYIPVYAHQPPIVWTDQPYTTQSNPLECTFGSKKMFDAVFFIHGYSDTPGVTCINEKLDLEEDYGMFNISNANDGFGTILTYNGNNISGNEGNITSLFGLQLYAEDDYSSQFSSSKMVYVKMNGNLLDSAELLYSMEFIDRPAWGEGNAPLPHIKPLHDSEHSYYQLGREKYIIQFSSYNSNILTLQQVLGDENIDQNTPFSIYLRCRLKSPASHAPYYKIINGHVSISYRKPQNKLMFSMLTNTLTLNATMNIDIPNNQWFNLTILCDYNYVKLYYNGIRILKMNMNGKKFRNNKYHIFFGKGSTGLYDLGAYQVFKGILDEKVMLESGSNYMTSQTPDLSFSNIEFDEHKVINIASNELHPINQNVISYKTNTLGEIFTNLGYSIQDKYRNYVFEWNVDCSNSLGQEAVGVYCKGDFSDDVARCRIYFKQVFNKDPNLATQPGDYNLRISVTHNGQTIYLDRRLTLNTFYFDGTPQTTVVPAVDYKGGPGYPWVWDLKKSYHNKIYDVDISFIEYPYVGEDYDFQDIEQPVYTSKNVIRIANVTEEIYMRFVLKHGWYTTEECAVIIRVQTPDQVLNIYRPLQVLHPNGITNTLKLYDMNGGIITDLNIDNYTSHYMDENELIGEFDEFEYIRLGPYYKEGDQLQLDIYFEGRNYILYFYVSAFNKIGYNQTKSTFLLKRSNHPTRNSLLLKKEETCKLQ